MPLRYDARLPTLLPVLLVLVSACQERSSDGSVACVDGIEEGYLTRVIYPSSVLVDGDLSDPAWNDPEVVWNMISHDAGMEPAADDSDLSARFALIADSTNLYLGVQVRDDAVVAKPTEPWCGDGVEIVIDAGDEKNTAPERGCSEGTLYDCNDGRFIISAEPQDTASGVGPYSSPVSEVSSWHLKSYRSRVGANGYAVEAAFDLRFPTPINLANGGRIGLSLSVFDRDAAGETACRKARIQWAEGARSQSTPELWPSRWGSASFCPQAGQPFIVPQAFDVGVTNAAPRVALDSPTSGSELVAGSNVSLLASATDQDGEVYRVEFEARSLATGKVSALGGDTRRPFGRLWLGVDVAPGAYELTAVAQDNRGALTRSLPVSVRVVDVEAAERVPWRILIAGEGATLGTPLTDSYRRPLWQMLQENGHLVDFWGRYVDPEGGTLVNPDFDQNHDVASAHFRIAQVRRTIGWPAGLPLWDNLQGELLRSGQDYTPTVRWTPLPPHIALLQLGHNDLAAGAKAEAIVEELRRVVEVLRETLSPTLTIILAQLYATEQSGAELKPLNAAIEQLAQSITTDASPVHVANLRRGFFVGTDTIDGVRPAPAGEIKLAESWSSALTPLLADPLPPPNVSPFGGVQREAVAVQLKHDSPKVSLHYTIDGEEPTARSPRYTRPIQLTAEQGIVTLKVRAVSAHSGDRQSRTVSATFDIRRDDTPPAVTDLVGFAPNKVLIRFSEPVDPLLAATPETYRIGSNRVDVAELRSNGTVVVLTLAEPLGGGENDELYFSGLTDSSPQANPISETAPYRIGYQPVGQGFQAEYFRDTYLRERAGLQIDPVIAQDWSGSTRLPGALCAGEASEPARCEALFGVRWSGWVRPPESGDYVVELAGTGWFRLWLGDELLANTPGFVKQEVRVALSALQAGELYPLRVEYAGWGDAPERRLTLRWRPPQGEWTNLGAPHVYPFTAP